MSGLIKCFCVFIISYRPLVDRLKNKVTIFCVADAIAALKKLDVVPAIPAYFRLALTPATVKVQLPNFSSAPLAVLLRHLVLSLVTNI